MHAVISLLIQSRKFWWYLLLTSSMLLHDVIITSYCCQQYAECLVTTFFQQDTAPHTTPRTRTIEECNYLLTYLLEVLRQETPNFLASKLWPPNSPDLGPVDYEILAVMQHRVYHRQIHSVDELKWRLIDVWCGLELSIFDEAMTNGKGDI